MSRTRRRISAQTFSRRASFWLFELIEREPAPAFAAAGLLARAVPAEDPAVQPACALIREVDDRARARDLLLVQEVRAGQALAQQRRPGPHLLRHGREGRALKDARQRRALQLH